MCNKSQKDGQKKGVDGHFPTSSGDHTWFQHIPCWLRGWGITEARHLVLMDEGGGGGGKVKNITYTDSPFSVCIYEKTRVIDH